MVEIFYVHLEFRNKNTEWSINLPFLCTKCGVCCTLDDFLMGGEIKATPEECPDIHKKLKVLYDTLAELIEKGVEIYDKYTTSTPCPFLNNKLCSIYPIRPEGCRQFPNTAFGMQSRDCEALDRFKKQCIALKRGRNTTITFHFTDPKFDPSTASKTVKPAVYTDKQYQICIVKLHNAGITVDELVLFNSLNGKS